MTTICSVLWKRSAWYWTSGAYSRRYSLLFPPVMSFVPCCHAILRVYDTCMLVQLSFHVYLHHSIRTAFLLLCCRTIVKPIGSWSARRSPPPAAPTPASEIGP